MKQRTRRTRRWFSPWRPEFRVPAAPWGRKKEVEAAARAGSGGGWLTRRGPDGSMRLDA